MSSKEKYKKFRIFLAAAGAIILALLLTALIMPYFSSRESVGEFAEGVTSLGQMGVVVFFLIQVLQVIIAFIPGEFVEFGGGVLFGTWLGALICTIGLFAGQYLVFTVVRRFGKRLVERIFNSGKLDRFEFLKNEKKLEYIAFVLFFIPGPPKDLLTYAFPLTKIDKWRFLIIATVARIPSVLTSAYAGATLSDGDIVKTVVVYIIIGALSVLGLFLNNRFMKTKDES